MDHPIRKRNRIPNYDYSTCGKYFVTICTAERKPFFRSVEADVIPKPKFPPLTPYGQIVQTAIEQIASHYQGVQVEKFCIMPDHIHMILSIDNTENGRMISAPTLSTVVGSMKRWISKQIRQPIWQKSFFDRVIRNEEEYLEIWDYIDKNPLKQAEDITP